MIARKARESRAGSEYAHASGAERFHRRTTQVWGTALLLIVALALPASAHSVSYQHIKSGSLECYPSSSTAKSVVDAKAHHRHKVGTLNAYIHNPDDGNWYTSSVNWTGITVAGYSLYNQSGRSHSTLNSYAYCT